MSMGNSDDSILMYGYDNNQYMQDGGYSQGMTASADEMEYNMMSSGMFNPYDNASMMF